MKFEDIKSESDIESFFQERKFKPIKEPDLFNDELRNITHYYYEMDEDENNFGVFVIPKDFNLSLIKKELLKDFSNLYQFIFYDSFNEFLFIQEISGTDKVVTVKKKRTEIKQILLNKINVIEFGNQELFEAIFDRSEIIKEFYDFYVISEQYLSKNIKGIPDSNDKDRFSQVILNRLMFLWFLQVKGFLNKDFSYLISKFNNMENENFYRDFLIKLFFEGLCKEQNERTSEVNELIGEIPYLNGGLFLPTELELKYEEKIEISNFVFYKPMHYPLSNEITVLPVLNLLESKPWTVDENSGDINELNPDILGFIFEKSINQRSLGAVYTPDPIVSRMCKQTLVEFFKHIVNKNKELSIEITKYEDLLKIENPQVAELFLKALHKITILDPACGSGAFLLKMLFLIEKMHLVLRKSIRNKKIPRRSILKENIVLNNIFGIDILPEACEIAKLRLFLAIAESYEYIDDIKPLPNVDFNMRSGNSILGIFEKKEGNLGDYFTESIGSLILERNKLIKQYTRLKSIDAIKKRGMILEKTEDLQDLFTSKLLAKIKVEDIPVKEFNDRFSPFHWSMEFSEILSHKTSGFDIIVGNPPYIRADSNDSFFQSYRPFVLPLFRTLYERWDIYIAFIELGLNLLKKDGLMSYIISDSFTTAKFASKMREVLINKKMYQLEFYPEVKIFENVGVNNIIFYLRNQKIDKDFRLNRLIFDSITNLKSTENLSLENLGDLCFRLIDITQILFLGELENIVKLGDICYVSYGMALNSDEQRFPGLFKKSDLVSDTKSEIHTVRYTENKYIERFHMKEHFWLEYNSDRVPSKVRRPTFPELYIVPKIFVGVMGVRSIFVEEPFYCNHSLMVLVPYHLLINVSNRVLNRKKEKLAIKKGSILSNKFDLRYIVGIINSKHTIDLINGIKRHRMKNYAYPNDIKEVPIYKATKKQQEIIINQVEKLSQIKIEKMKSVNESQLESLKIKYKVEYEKLNHLIELLYSGNLRSDNSP